MDGPALVISGATVGYGKGNDAIAVISSINAVLYKGEVVALIGRNGAGKSTLLRTIAAYQQPLSGIMELSGKSVEGMAPCDVARNISVVLTAAPQPALSVRELVSLGRMPYTNLLGRLSPYDNDIVSGAMEEMGILHLAGRKVSALSDGERQRCMIAKALAQETPVIMLDEPTAFLDYPSKVHLMSMLGRLAHEKGKAVLVSTHDMELALRMADRIWLVEGGSMHCGTAAELSSLGILHSFIDSDTMRYNGKENRIELI